MRPRSVRATLAVLATLILCCGGISTAIANPLIGLNLTTATAATPDPTNWNRVSILSGTVDNLIDETGATTPVSFNITPVVGAGFLYLSTSTLAADAVPQYDYSLAGMTGYGFRASGVFSLEFSGLEPNQPYEYWVVGYRGAATIDNLVSVSNGDVPAFETFNQFIASTDNDGRFLVNTAVSSNTQQWNDLSFLTTSSSTGTLTFGLEGVTQTTVLGAMAIRLVPEPTSLMGVFGIPLLLLLRARRR